MAMSEQQKVRAKWIGRGKKLSIAISFGLLVWSGYALVNFKPVEMDAKPQNPNAELASSQGAAVATAGAGAKLQKPGVALPTAASLTKAE